MSEISELQDTANGLNEDVMVQMGNDAQALLDNDIFNRTINNLVEATFQAWCNIAPANKEEREQIYHHYRALVDIVHTLKQRVSVRDQIVTKNASDVDELDDNSGDE